MQNTVRSRGHPFPVTARRTGQIIEVSGLQGKQGIPQHPRVCRRKPVRQIQSRFSKQSACPNPTSVRKVSPKRMMEPLSSVIRLIPGSDNQRLLPERTARTFEQRCVCHSCEARRIVPSASVTRTGRLGAESVRDCVLILPEMCIAHIFCPLLHRQGLRTYLVVLSSQRAGVF